MLIFWFVPPGSAASSMSANDAARAAILSIVSSAPERIAAIAEVCAFLGAAAALAMIAVVSALMFRMATESRVNPLRVSVEHGNQVAPPHMGRPQSRIHGHAA